MRTHSDPEVRGKRLALRFAAVQLAGALLVAIIVAVITDGSNAMATVAGGAVVAVWLALDVSDLAPLPFLLGMLAGQVGFWVGVAFIKEDK